VASPGSCFEEVIWMPIVSGIFLSSSLKRRWSKKKVAQLVLLKPSINKEE
jgi:hypothetical protein